MDFGLKVGISSENEAGPVMGVYFPSRLSADANQ